MHRSILILGIPLITILFLFGCTMSDVSLCGDTICNVDETTENCPTDCGTDNTFEIPPLPSGIPFESGITSADIEMAIKGASEFIGSLNEIATQSVKLNVGNNVFAFAIEPNDLSIKTFFTVLPSGSKVSFWMGESWTKYDSNQVPSEKIMHAGDAISVEVPSEATYLFVGTTVAEAQPILIKEKWEYFGIPKCYNDYTNEKLLYEINESNANCNRLWFFKDGKWGGLTSRELLIKDSNGQMKLARSIIGEGLDILVDPETAYGLECNSNVSFEWKPTCAEDSEILNLKNGTNVFALPLTLEKNSIRDIFFNAPDKTIINFWSRTQGQWNRYEKIGTQSLPNNVYLNAGDVVTVETSVPVNISLAGKKPAEPVSIDFSRQFTYFGVPKCYENYTFENLAKEIHAKNSNCKILWFYINDKWNSIYYRMSFAGGKLSEALYGEEAFLKMRVAPTTAFASNCKPAPNFSWRPICSEHTCGNEICETGETNFNCSVDCEATVEGFFVTKTLSKTNYKVGEKGMIKVLLNNNTSEIVNAVVFENEENWFEIKDVDFFEEDVMAVKAIETTVPAMSLKEVAIEIALTQLGNFISGPTTVLNIDTNELIYSNSVDINVGCNKNTSCETNLGENSINCSSDCSVSITDDFCDPSADGIVDPDCGIGFDSDYEYSFCDDEKYYVNNGVPYAIAVKALCGGN